MAIPPKKLGGEIDPNAWTFSRIGEDGPLPNPIGHTFPIVTHDVSGKWSVIGTGFYISNTGFFVTARHVVEEVFDAELQRSPLLILQFVSPTNMFAPSECILRHISQCWLGAAADVALGVAAPLKNRETGKALETWAWTLALTTPPNGTMVVTHAFPNHVTASDGKTISFQPDTYDGIIEETGDFRDRVNLPFPYLQVSTRIHGGASGGPIIGNGRVVGINCSELAMNVDHAPGPGFGAQSRCLAEAYLDNVALPGEAVLRRVTFSEMAQARVLNAELASEARVYESSGRLVYPHMRPTAALPRIFTAFYA